MLVYSMTSRFGVFLLHLIQTFNKKSILILCVNWLFLVDRLAQDQSLHKRVLCSAPLLSGLSESMKSGDLPASLIQGRMLKPWQGNRLYPEDL